MKQLVYHSSPTCTPCKTLRPMVEAITEELGHEFVYIDVESNKPVVDNIFSVPTVAIFNNGELETVLSPTMVKKANVRKALES